MYKALIALAIVAVLLPSTASAHTRKPVRHWSDNTPQFNCPKMAKDGKHCDELYLLKLKQA